MRGYTMKKVINIILSLMMILSLMNVTKSVNMVKAEEPSPVKNSISFTASWDVLYTFTVAVGEKDTSVSLELTQHGSSFFNIGKWCKTYTLALDRPVQQKVQCQRMMQQFR